MYSDQGGLNITSLKAHPVAIVYNCLGPNSRNAIAIDVTIFPDPSGYDCSPERLTFPNLKLNYQQFT